MTALPPERIHAMTVDVEDWFNATILQETGKVYPPQDAVERNALDLLDLFETHGIRATWFFLGEVAEAFPGLVRRVADAGHEIGVHGFHHHQVGALSAEKFRDAAVRAKQAVEQAGGRPAPGYRAVDFSIDQSTWWALDILLDAGFAYDASIFPMRLPRYGMAGAQTGPHWLKTPRGRQMYEVPVTVCEFAGLRLPFAGGGYFRLLPQGVLRLLMRRAARRQVVFYMHPCEIETAGILPAFPPGLTPGEEQRVRQCFAAERRGRKKGREKLGRLFSAYRFRSISEAFAIGGIQ